MIDSAALEQLIRAKNKINFFKDLTYWGWYNVNNSKLMKVCKLNCKMQQ